MAEIDPLEPDPEPQAVIEPEVAPPPEAIAAPALPYISEDVGKADSGGASKTQRVRVARPDGTDYHAHAKFAADTAGGAAAEGGARGLASELLASRLAVALGAGVPRVEVVLLPDQMTVNLV